MNTIIMHYIEFYQIWYVPYNHTLAAEVCYYFDFFSSGLLSGGNKS